MTLLIDSRCVASALPRIQKGLSKYCWLQDHLHSCDVSHDVEYQRVFVGFYRVRRSAEWRGTFFHLLQARKATGLSFREALEVLVAKTSRVEASFASKLVATIDPHQPVIDSVVLRNLGLRLPAVSAANRLARVVDLHVQLASWYEAQLSSATGISVVKRFRVAYPHVNITDTKALDLVLWQTRSAI